MLAVASAHPRRPGARWRALALVVTLVVLLAGLGAVMLGSNALRAEADKVRASRGAPRAKVKD